jgi:hypothetical protein
MQKVAASAALAAAVGLLAPPAHAIRPDFDGEQGLEVFFRAGYGSLVNTSERVFQSISEATAAGTPANALSGTYNLALGVGYRFMPLVSAGAFVEVQGQDIAPLVTPAGATPSSGFSWGLGAYARFYFMPLVSGSLHVRRVNLAGPGDARRFDPWASLGVQYFALTRNVQQPGTPLGASWSVASLAVPIAAGFDYRVITELALGVSLGIAPMATLSSAKTETFMQGGNVVTRTGSFDNATGGNALWYVGFDLRYTLSL